MLDFTDLIDVADKLGIIQAVKGKLLKQPDPAADKLVTALEEVFKIYSAIENGLSQYLALTFDPSDPTELTEERTRLLTLEGGEVKARMGQARGHCSKISNIYSRYLYPWFDRVLPRADVEVLADLFRSLDQFDGQMLSATDSLADWLTLESSEFLNLVDTDKFGEANQRVRAARKDVLPQRQAISRSMRTLLDLQAEFIGLAGAI